MSLYNKFIGLACLIFLCIGCSEQPEQLQNPTEAPHEFSYVTGTNHTPRETLFYDPFLKYWRDESGQCHTCTPDNGFSSEGVVSVDGQKIKWHGFRLKLLNDLEEAPDAKEVAVLIQNAYVLFSEEFSVYVKSEQGHFDIIIPAPLMSGEIDLVDPRGHLAADYFIQTVN